MTYEQCGAKAVTRRAAGGRRQRYCSEVCAVSAYRAAHPDAAWKWEMRKYGISADEYRRMLHSQGGECAICHRPPQANRLSVDHDHTTGAVRGLLCAPCNRHVGYFEKFGNGITRYLLRPRGQHALERQSEGA